MRLTAAITHEPPWYVARCLEVEVASQGETVEDAMANLKEALELYFEDAPAPDIGDPPIIASVEIAARVRSFWLTDAVELKLHVPAYLLGQKRLPRRLPDYVGFGDYSEAVAYAAGATALWASVPGAVTSLEF